MWSNGGSGGWSSFEILAMYWILKGGYMSYCIHSVYLLQEWKRNCIVLIFIIRADHSCRPYIIISILGLIRSSTGSYYFYYQLDFWWGINYYRILEFLLLQMGILDKVIFLFMCGIILLWHSEALNGLSVFFHLQQLLRTSTDVDLFSTRSIVLSV